MRGQLLDQPRRAQAGRPDQIRDRLKARLRLGRGGDSLPSARPPIYRSPQPGVRPGGADRPCQLAPGVRVAGSHAIATAQIRLGPQDAGSVKVAGRDRWTRLTDSQLLAQCEADTYRASGPGGQKRNKTSSAVRLRHSPSGLIVIAEESRSQHENRARALRRLRQALYLKIREELPAESLAPGFLKKLAEFGEAHGGNGRLALGRKD